MNKIITALLSIVLVRILSKDNYGAYSYVFNIVSFFIIFNGLGVTSALLQIGSEAIKDKSRLHGVFAYGARRGILCDVVMALAMLFVGIFIPFEFAGANTMMAIYCAYPLVLLLFEVRQTALRVELKNREYALMTNIQTVLLALFSVLGALIWQVYGLIFGQYAAMLLSWVVIKARNPLSMSEEGRNLTKADRRDFWHIALMSAMNNGLSQMLPLMGVFFVGALIGNEAAVASYKVATTIPFALVFIPSSVMVYLYPYFVRHKSDRSWTLRRFFQLEIVSIVSMGILTLALIVLARPIVVLIFGSQYEDAIPAFDVLMVGFFLTAAFRQPAGNLLVTQRKLTFNFMMGIMSVIVCVVTSLLLIPMFASVGAAWGYTITMGIGAICNLVFYLIIIGRSN